MSDVPEVVLRAYDLSQASIQPISMGWINRSFEVQRGAERFVLQRLHPVFRPEVNLDIDAITRHLEQKGVRTPRLVPNRDGGLWIEHDGCWRLASFVPGQVHTALDGAQARSAARLIARFHNALSDLDHRFAFTRPGAHDTPAHLARLRAAGPTDPTAAMILAHPLPLIPSLPVRIIHGDLKTTNIVFDGTEAVALIDLDTLAHGTIAIELGDALRSWCNTTSESDPDAVLDRAIFAAAVEGYAGAARGWIEPVEARCIASGIETIAIELAARFATDAIEDRYFGWDATRFASRVEHNRARARAQLHFAQSVQAQRAELDAIATAAFASPP